jgi:transketolase N-terminal domain/subunit
MKDLEKRIIEISYKKNLSHLSSNLSAINIIDEIYSLKNEDEPFVLSCGHCGLALYVVLEKYYGFDAEKLYEKYGTHPSRNLDDKIYCSSGSLGLSANIALGMAISNRSRNVYTLISDGESFEGEIYCLLNNQRRFNLKNLIICVLINGHSALSKFPISPLLNRLVVLNDDINIIYSNLPENLKFLDSVEGHYHKLTEKEYNKLINESDIL